DAFDRVVSIKNLQTDRHQKQKQIEELDSHLALLGDRMKRLCDKVNLHYQTPENAIQRVLQKAEEQRESLKKVDMAKSKLKSLEEQHDEVSAKLNSCNEQIKGLMLLAKTEG
ncbi:hypothetical protein R0K18_25375, partial [Pantoea sp. SIMBA_133]